AGADVKAVEVDKVLARLLAGPVGVEDHIHRIAVERDLALAAVWAAGDVLDHGKAPSVSPALKPDGTDGWPPRRPAQRRPPIPVREWWARAPMTEGSRGALFCGNTSAKPMPSVAN